MSKHITGIVVRMSADRGFAIVATEEGDIFVHSKAASGKWQYFTDYSSVKVEYTTEYNDRAKTGADRYRKVATRVISVEAPEEFEVLTQVSYFDPAKGFGRIAVGEGFSSPSAFLSGRVCEAAGLGRPGPGMPIRAIVVEGPKGPVATSFEWGPAIEAEYAAKNQSASEEAELKFFNRKKGFGFFIRSDGSEIHFHISGVAKELVDRFYHDKRMTGGARCKFILGEHHGKPTAKVIELIELAPEADKAVEDLMAEHAAETQSAIGQVPAEPEAKPAKAPRKKAAAKPKAEAAPKPAKKAAAPKKTSAKKDPKAAEAPADEAADIVSMAKEACSNGGGAVAQAFLAAATPAGNA